MRRLIGPIVTVLLVAGLAVAIYRSAREQFAERQIVEAYCEKALPALSRLDIPQAPNEKLGTQRHHTDPVTNAFTQSSCPRHAGVIVGRYLQRSI
jgi:hypothetical protein